MILKYDFMRSSPGIEVCFKMAAVGQRLRGSAVSVIAVLLRTPITHMIVFNQGILLLGSNHFRINDCCVNERDYLFLTLVFHSNQPNFLVNFSDCGSIVNMVEANAHNVNTQILRKLRICTMKIASCAKYRDFHAS